MKSFKLPIYIYKLIIIRLREEVGGKRKKHEFCYNKLIFLLFGLLCYLLDNFYLFGAFFRSQNAPETIGYLKHGLLLQNMH